MGGAPFPNPAEPGTWLVPLGDGYFAIIDAADVRAVARRRWRALVDTDARRTIYAVTHIDGRPVRLHRFLWRRWRLAAARLIDHRNTNGLDCRRQNLRRATFEQNNANQPLRRDNISGCKGVSWDARKGRWRARVQANGQRRNLGYFESPIAAQRARQRAARELHGEFARSA